jgi:hypothetical protein
MSSVVVGIPTLNRPQRVADVAASCRASVGDNNDLRIVFLCSPGDTDTIDACHATGEETQVVEWEPVHADWARKLNGLYSDMGEEWMLCGADDLRFRVDWFDNCLKAAKRLLPGGACVVGTNDLGNQRVVAGYHSTHPLVHRDYIQCGGVVDDPTRILPECYGHWFVDDEFVQVAQVRMTYAHAHDAIVEHMHPEWGKALRDETYEHGYKSIPTDRDLFITRQRLWRHSRRRS